MLEASLDYDRLVQTGARQAARGEGCQRIVATHEVKGRVSIQCAMGQHRVRLELG